MRLISGRPRTAATVTCSRTAISSRRLERGHQLTGPHADDARDIEHRGARRRVHREPSRKMARRQPSLGREHPNLRVDLVSIHVQFREAWAPPEASSHRFDRATDFRSRPRIPASRLVSDPFVQSRLIDSGSSPKAARVDAAFFGEYFDNRASPRRGKPLSASNFASARMRKRSRAGVVAEVDRDARRGVSPAARRAGRLHGR